MIRLLTAALISSVIVAVPSSASAECTRVDEVVLVQGVAQVNTKYVCTDDTVPVTDDDARATQPRDSGLDALCVQEALSADIDPFIFCDIPRDIDQSPVITPGLVLAAFRRLPLPEAGLVIQPPNGRTLVNFETNFYTEQGEFTRTVNLLGRRVELRIWPAAFRWRFGDGASDQTTSPGAAYPDLEVTHSYARTGRVSPSLDTTYAARFRVGGGPWQDVAGTVTIPGSPQSLRVVEARPVLVGG